MDNRVFLDMHHEAVMERDAGYFVVGETVRVAGFRCYPSGFWDVVVSDMVNSYSVPFDAVRFIKAEPGTLPRPPVPVEVYRTVTPKEGMQPFISGQHEARLDGIHFTGRALFVTVSTVHGRHFLPMDIFKYRHPLWRRKPVAGYFGKD